MQSRKRLNMLEADLVGFKHIRVFNFLEFAMTDAYL